MKKWISSLFLLGLVFLLSACSNDGAKPSELIEGKEEEIAEVEEDKEISPLTGLEAIGENNKRPIAVMINNHPEARPQSGLHKADIIYEVLAEGNITRLLAIYQSKMPEIIGSVRSAREYYVDLSKGYDAIYISHGWSPSAKEQLEAGGIDYLNGLFYDGTLFWRSKERKAPHNSYISYENIVKGANEKKYNLEDDVKPLVFLSSQELDNIQGETAEKVLVKYGKQQFSQAVYGYDENEERYTRSSNNKITADLESDETVFIDNILIAEMKHYYIDNDGRRGIDLTSGGKAYLLQKGKIKEIEWVNEDGRIIPVQNGEQVKLVPGRTWINIVPNLKENVSTQL
ncbi:DUF3048 domain-containing protein [Metabacillus fastidiosus]|uniref:DUF3048 domain-containing protein n=1 Tax=Metabacillus fastidiosus TaxID=1458 RepID=UPI000826605B|nr:DUF3048 domain-containing protein [Metabacillus fastidiosus]